MAIPTSITDLDVNEAMNSPAGSDNVGGTLDNYLRAHAMIIRRQFSKGANVNSASTTILPPDCSFLNVVKVVSTINAFSDSFDGRIVYIKFEAGITLAHSTALVLPTAENVVTEADDVACFINESSGVWRCLSYPNFMQRDISDLAAGKVDKAGDTMTGPLTVPSELTVLPQDASNEGGEVILKGAGSNHDVALDNHAGTIRLLGLGIQMLQVGPTDITYGSNSLYHTGNLTPLVRGASNNSAGTAFSSWQAPSIATINSSGNSTNVPLRIENGGNASASAVIGFYRSGLYGAFFGLDTDNKFKVGGWSMGDVSYEIWHAGNFNPATKADRVQCNYHSDTFEFGTIAQTLAETVDAPAPYVMTGLRTLAGDPNRLYLRGRTLRTY